MKDFFRDHPFLASAVTLLSVWSVTGTVRYVATVKADTKKEEKK